MTHLEKPVQAMSRRSKEKYKASRQHSSRSARVTSLSNGDVCLHACTRLQDCDLAYGRMDVYGIKNTNHKICVSYVLVEGDVPAYHACTNTKNDKFHSNTAHLYS